ncbi:LuxR family transcriptional regulator [Arthrobacter sp. B3I4]|uniref:helix-turn-helix transcriptional regulator n=1 Tax=Arthrobacter sp. B3I4 TaxID=3042267 RepID=UPI0027D7E58A|nr:LuxR family transcriptional regulator [Arthrobacter sp. B3I4]
MASSKARPAAPPEEEPLVLTGRTEDLRSAAETLKSGMHAAVLLVGDHGIGKSTLMAAVAAELQNDVTPVRLHGSQALSQVPYGVLAPFIVDLPVEDATSQLAVLRTFWSYLEEQRRATRKPLLLIVDDAHDLDEATAGILVELAAAGWTKLLVSSAARPGLPEPLLELWFEGIAERHDLRPLTREQTAELLAQKLGSQVLPSVAEVLWAASAGNPLLLSCLLDDAKGDGTLIQRNGVWLLTRPLNSHGERLTDVVRRQLLRRSAEERTALNLVALSEPVPRALIEAMVGGTAVAGLIEQELLRVTGGAEPELRLWHAVYGDALRNLVSPARSLQLRQDLLRLMDREPASAEALLRQVSWSLECGLEVDDRQLLRAAGLAARLSEDELARKAASQVKDPELQISARCVTAQTYYNTSNHAAALDILDGDFGKGRTVSSLLSGSLLWAAVLSALGHPPAEIVHRSQALLLAGDRLARDNPEDADAILTATRDRVRTIHSMVLALAGDEEAAGNPTGEVFDGQRASGLEQAFRLVLEAERLLIQGKPDSAYKVAGAALQAARTEDEELHFLSDYLMVRAVTAVIHGGNWSAVETLLGEFAASFGPSLISLGGAVHTAAGIMMLYQGRAVEAKKTLRAALEALRLADPQQLFSLTAAMAFSAAAEIGAKAKAAQLLADYESSRPPASRYLRALAAMAVVYGKARLDGHRGAVEELQRLGTPGGKAAAGLEFNALTFRLALGDRAAAARLRELQPELEGRRAAAVCGYAVALEREQAGELLEAAKVCEESELWGFAAQAYGAAAAAYREAGDTLRERMAKAQQQRCRDVAESAAGEEPDGQHGALDLLTRRERDIVALAVRGLSDRQIAAELHVSVRTVEGHLYRSYAKLNIKGREDLRRIAAD